MPDYLTVIRGPAARLAKTDGVKRPDGGSSISAVLAALILAGALFVATPARIAIIRWRRPVGDLAELTRRNAPKPGTFR